MAEFFTQLFTSIFTPGPTPSLVLATNVSFATLQILLLILVAATRSVHFMALSFLSAGLWWAINWFVRELEAAKAAQQKDASKGGGGSTGGGTKVGRRDRIVEDSETETEEVTGVDSDGRLRENLHLRVHEGKRTGRAPSRASASGTDSEWDKVEVEDD